MRNNINYSELDPGVIPLVRYFNSVGLSTYMSCQGHNKTNMSMFWIQFHPLITQEEIIQFQKEHTNRIGGFSCNGRFVQRILANTTGFGSGIHFSYQYMAATVEAAMEDLKHWEEQDNETKPQGQVCTHG